MSAISARAAAKIHTRKRPFRPEYIVFAACELFALFSLLRFGLGGETENALKSAEAIALVLLPLLAERLFRCRIASWLYVLIMLYGLGPLLGHSYKLFYLTSWCDKLQHAFGGFLFALIGFYLPQLAGRGSGMRLGMRALFAICFSIAVSAVWEMFEFAFDALLDSDMQNDTYITAIHSYFLGNAAGEMGSIGRISSVTVNGVPMAGYIDIGLIDTMADMIVETLGAVAAAVFFAADKDRHPAFQKAPGRRESPAFGLS